MDACPLQALAALDSKLLAAKTQTSKIKGFRTEITKPFITEFRVCDFSDNWNKRKTHMFCIIWLKTTHPAETVNQHSVFKC